MPGFTEIENYEPSDEGWGVVIGPFIRPEHRPRPEAELPAEVSDDERDEDVPADEDTDTE